MTNLFTCFSSSKVCQCSPKGLRLLLAFFVVFSLGVGNVWGALSSPSTCTFSTKTDEFLYSSDNTDVLWFTSSTAGDIESTGDARGARWGGSVVNGTGGLTLTCDAYNPYKITKIEVVWSRNNSKGATVSAKVGGNTFGSSDTYVASITNRTATFSGSASGTITINATSTSNSNSFYIKSIKVTYTTGSGGADSYTDILFAKYFNGYSTNSYSAAGTDYTTIANSTNATGTTYALQVFNGSNGQIKGGDNTAKNNFNCRNTTTYSGYYISQVSLTVSSGTIDGSTTGRSVVYFGKSAYSDPSTAAPTGTYTSAYPSSSGQTTLTWTNSDIDVSHFILYNLKTAGSAYSGNTTNSLHITWTKKPSCTQIGAPTVTATRGDEKITLTWANQTGASSYIVTRTPEDGTIGTPTKSGSTWTCEITGLTNGTDYTWNVVAVGDGDTYCEEDNVETSGSTTPVVMHTVTWKKNGGSYTTTTVADGEQPEFPDDPTSCDADNYGYFYGWSTSEFIVTGDISGKTIYTIAATMPVVTTDDVVYHAVFSDYAHGSYTLVASDPGAANWAGEYLIAYSSTVFADGRIGGTGTGGIGASGTSVSPGDYLSSSTVSAQWGDNYYVTLEKIGSTSTYLLKTQDGYYNYQTSNSNGLLASNNSETADDYPISVTFTSSSDIKLGLGGTAAGAVFRYNTGGYFRYYKDGGQNAVYLYKRSARSSAKYLTSCCTNLITIDEPDITGSGDITFNQVSPIPTCSGVSTIKATLTLTSGYQATALSFSVNSGSVSVEPTISTPINENTEYTLTFTENQNATLTTTATIAAKPLNSISLSPASGEVYVGQYTEFAITYAPTDILTKGTTNYATPSYCVTTGTTNTILKLTGGKAGVSITENKTETVTIKANADNTKTASVSLTVKPLPYVTFIDNVHNKTDFVGLSDDKVVATISDNELAKVKTTPTHADLSTPASGNACELSHLHLIGWIRSDYSKVANYMNGTGDAPTNAEITGAGQDANDLDYFLAPGADIDVLDYEGLTFYAVWSKVE